MSSGLCETCRFHTIVATKRGREFHLCELSKSDSSYPKYPRLPVLHCAGYTPADETKKKDKSV